MREGFRTHRIAWARRRSQDAKRAAHCTAGPWELSTAEAEAKHIFRSPEDVRIGASEMAQRDSRVVAVYVIGDMKLPRGNTGVVSLISGCAGGTWGFDVA